MVLNEISGALIHAPNDTAIFVGGNKIHALVIDRGAFDCQLAESAESAGAVIRCRRRVSGIRLKNDVVQVFGPERLEADYVIGADGAKSLIARCINATPPRNYIHALQTIIPTPADINSVEVFVGTNIAPGFFAWKIPEETGIRVGVGVTAGHNIRQYFNTLLNHLHIKPGVTVAGTIPIGMRMPLQRERVALLGDAAGQVKPTSGGGLYPGLMGAHLLAIALEKSADELTALDYQKTYLKIMGKGLRQGMLIYNQFAKMDNTKINQIFAAIDDNIIETINMYGDLDYPTMAAKALVKRHIGLLRFLLPY
jgi:flavin-dependent dehydrogenase